MIVMVDVDNTLCDTPKGDPPDYSKRVPRQWAIDKINKLYDEGNAINIWTAAGGTQAESIRMDIFQLTCQQMKDWGVKYHSITILKPTADLYVDDKAIRIEDL